MLPVLSASIIIWLLVVTDASGITPSRKFSISNSPGRQIQFQAQEALPKINPNPRSLPPSASAASHIPSPTPSKNWNPHPHTRREKDEIPLKKQPSKMNPVTAFFRIEKFEMGFYYCFSVTIPFNPLFRPMSQKSGGESTTHLPDDDNMSHGNVFFFFMFFSLVGCCCVGWRKAEARRSKLHKLTAAQALAVCVAHRSAASVSFNDL